MPAVIPIIIAAVAGAGIAEGINALETSGKNKQPALPAVPSLDSAATTAQGAQTTARQAALAGGGQTNITGGSGIILGSDVSSLTLVGSA